MVVGCPGTGKTTLATTLAERYGLTFIELDALFHQENWTPRPTEAFQAEVRALTSENDRWVVDGNYHDHVAHILAPLVDTVVWLDLDRPLVMRRVIARTLRRAVRREELWNGNREPLTNFTRWDPEKNIIRWAWVHHPKYRARYARSQSDGQWGPAVAVYRLRSPAEVEAFLA